ncbi:rifin [Plasmodium reichenowi]|uniref:Rifin n=1 Tax=Plasmodium reichenowi TaxID=5854 RepID=A0A060RQL2_PLARE|nr:rifin [Plasmodium reichenowi]
MIVHYINILLFALPLNILIRSLHKKTSTTPNHIQNNRSLCECELYAPANYDNDPQMKKVMEHFDQQASQRLREYDERLQEKRKQCKEKCDKEIQKIILKDKLEKELMDKFATLQSDIQSDAIPTCVCEKSVADKVEKGCLRCGGVLGEGVMPGMGLIDGSLLGAISVLQPAAITAAKEAAVTEATALATQEGMKAVISIIEKMSVIYEKHQITGFISSVNEKNFKSAAALRDSVVNLFNKSCNIEGGDKATVFCQGMVLNSEDKTFNGYVNPGIAAFQKEYSSQKELLETAKVGAVEATYASYQTAIIASIVAIVVIVLIMVIIYKILRYRRKKKMKKKLQYIKLLEE